MMAKVLVKKRELVWVGKDVLELVHWSSVKTKKSETQKQQMGGCRPNPARRCVLFGLRNVYRQSI